MGYFDLQMFAGEGGEDSVVLYAPQAGAQEQAQDGQDGQAQPEQAEQAGDGAQPDAEAPGTETPDGEQREPQEDPDADFDRLVEEKYKKQFSARVQKALQQRFKTRAQDVENAELRSYLEEKLGVTDAKRIREMLERADARAQDRKADTEPEESEEEEAYRTGKTAGEIRSDRALRREREQREALQKRLDDMEQSQREEQERRADIAKWSREAETLKERYPQFDLAQEIRDPETGARFIHYLKGAGMTVEEAYEAIHAREINRRMMQAAAQETEKRTVESIQARQRRPAEAGTGNNAPAVPVKPDPSKFTKADFDAIDRLLAQGKTVRLS